MLHELEVSSIKSDMDSCRICVICRLRAVHMIIWRAMLIFSKRQSHDLKSTICNYLIGIHVCCGTCSSLDHIYRKELMMLALKNLTACLGDGFVLCIRKKTKLVVSLSCSKFCYSQSVDKQWVIVQMETADRKVFKASQGLYAIK